MRQAPLVLVRTDDRGAGGRVGSRFLGTVRFILRAEGGLNLIVVLTDSLSGLSNYHMVDVRSRVFEMRDSRSSVSRIFEMGDSRCQVFETVLFAGRTGVEKAITLKLQD